MIFIAYMMSSADAETREKMNVVDLEHLQKVYQQLLRQFIYSLKSIFSTRSLKVNMKWWILFVLCNCKYESQTFCQTKQGMWRNQVGVKMTWSQMFCLLIGFNRIFFYHLWILDILIVLFNFLKYIFCYILLSKIVNCPSVALIKYFRTVSFSFVSFHIFSYLFVSSRIFSYRLVSYLVILYLFRIVSLLHRTVSFCTVP